MFSPLLQTTNLRFPCRVVPHVFKAPGWISPAQYRRRSSHSIASYHQHHNNPLLCGPWLKAANGELTMVDLAAFFESPPDIPSSIHPVLKGAFKGIFLPASLAKTQEIIEPNGKLKKVRIASLTQHPMGVGTVNGVIDLGANVLINNEHPTLADILQFIAAHARVLKVVHDNLGTLYPVTLGIVKVAQFPSPSNTPIIISTSIPRYKDRVDRKVRNLVHDGTREALEREVGGRLPQRAGRCVENSGFLGHRDLLRNHTEMYSVVFGVEQLVVLPDPKTGVYIDKALLAAKGAKEIIEVVWRNNGCLFEMCLLCEEAREAMNGARVLDLATEFRTKTLEEVLGLFA